MKGKDEVFELINRALREAEKTGNQAEIVWMASTEATMRSAAGEVHQTPTARESILTILLSRGLKSVSASIGECSDVAIQNAIGLCAEALPHVPDNPYLPDLNGQPKILPEEQFGWDKIPDLTESDLNTKQLAFELIRKYQSRSRFSGSARFFTGIMELGIANSAGLLRYHTAHASSFALTVSSEGGISSYVEEAALAPRDLQFERVVNEAFERAALADSLPFYDPFSDGEGARKFDLILTPWSVAEWINWTIGTCFDGLSAYEGDSYFAGKSPGEVVAAESITITDDPLHPQMIPLPFDASGFSKSRLPLIEAGRYRSLMYDCMSAKKAGANQTGHSGAPMALVFEGGSETFEDLVAKSKKPTIVATYLNYPGLPDQVEAVFTATTRHGTFLVKDGEYKFRCPPLRLTDKSFEMLKHVDGLSEQRLVIASENYDMFHPNTYYVPAMRIKDVQFVGSNTTQNP